MNKRILVTGGSGLVGKHLNDIMSDAIYISSKDFDLTDIDRVDAMMDFFRPKIVVHLAARVGGILDNITYPVDYLEQNILMNTNVLQKCHEYKVDRVITILSTCAYPDVLDTYPMKEEDLFNGPPPPDNFSYAMSKRCMATHIDSYVKQYRGYSLIGYIISYINFFMWSFWKLSICKLGKYQVIADLYELLRHKYHNHIPSLDLYNQSL